MSHIKRYLFLFLLSSLFCFKTAGQTNDYFIHTITGGETVYSIATMYGVSQEEIFRLNPGSEKTIISGETLKIPQTKLNGKSKSKFHFHTIQAKETLYSLSHKYSVPATAIIDANPGLSVSSFTIGKIIRIPTDSIKEQSEVQKTKETIETVDYSIKKKETIYSISKQFETTPSELIALNPNLKNGIKNNLVIKVPVKKKVVVKEEAPDETSINSLLDKPRHNENLTRMNVALLLPFKAEASNHSQATLRFTEYYEGLLLAIDSLKSLGYNIDLSVFDLTDVNGTDLTDDALKTTSLQKANLIIGGVDGSQIERIAAFAEKHKIAYVIPFTSKNNEVLSNQYVYQVNTPHTYLYAKASAAACTLFSDANVIILNVADKEQKADFIKVLKSDMKRRNIHYKELTYSRETFPNDLEKTLRNDKRNIVIPTTGSSTALNKIRVPIRTISEKNPQYLLTLFGYPEWQTYTSDCLDDFYALNTYIYSNFYVDNLSSNVAEFYSKYKHWYSKSLINTFPKYGILGFDTGMYFLCALSKYGTGFCRSLDKFSYDCIQTGFNFDRVNNWGGFINTNIFIVHYHNNYKVTRETIAK